MATPLDFSALLRPLDSVKISMQCSAATGDADTGDAKETYDALLAVVGREEGLDEHAGVFIYRVYAKPGPGARSPLVLQRAFPITADFSLQVSVPPPSSSTDAPDAPLLPSGGATAQTDAPLALTVCQAATAVLTLSTRDRQRLQAVMAVYRPLQAQAVDAGLSADAFPWLAPYALHPSSWLSVLPPPDLRHTRTPLHARLSEGFAGMSRGDVVDYLALRDDWLQTRPRRELLRDAEPHRLRVRVGTFNVNGKMPPDDLSSWIRGPSSGRGRSAWERLIPPLKEVSPFSMGEGGQHLALDREPPADIAPEGESPEEAFAPDVLVLAFQELDLSTEALFTNARTTREDAWTRAVFDALGDKREAYAKLASKQLVGMLLLVFVKRDIADGFAVHSSAVGAGLMGIMGNKGAVALRLAYRPPPTASAPTPTPTVLTFTNAHLAAFDDMLDRRNADFHDVSRRLAFGPCEAYVAAPMADIYSSDVLFWMVHLNYRLTSPSADVREILRTHAVRGAADTLLKFDQLKGAIRTRKAFEHFEEHRIAFRPTYRFSEGLVADTLGYDMKRKPAWTDRILYIPSPFTPVQQLSYTSHPDITVSDHRPVSANFIVEVPCIDATALETAAHALYRAVADVDPDDPDDIPLLRLEDPTIEFGDVMYDRPVSKTLAVTNVGKIPAAFRFLPRAAAQPICQFSSSIACDAPLKEKPSDPSWLYIEPMTGFLLPSETVELTFTAHVTSATAQPLNLGAEQLMTTLILHTLLGKDHFLFVSGTYRPTCFGNSLDVLTRLPKPLRELQGGEELIAEAKAINAPREVMALVNWLMSNDAETVNDLFLVRGDAALVLDIRERLDTNAPLPDPPSLPSSGASSTHSHADLAHAVATTLLALLDSLTEPVIPTALHARCADVQSREAAFEMLSALPPASVNVWISITACLHLFASAHADTADETLNDPNRPPTRRCGLLSCFETIPTLPFRYRCSTGGALCVSLSRVDMCVFLPPTGTLAECGTILSTHISRVDTSRPNRYCPQRRSST
ncbi:Endonuclease/exonuclease/phosphatase [Amylostereum chailletii]|nr:Endonuclease/exonuclease/phosphatase [Amylostereum chailletii]